MPDGQNDETSRIGRPREVSDEEILETGRGIANQGLTVSGSRLRGRIRRGNPYTLKRRWDELQADGMPSDTASEVDGGNGKGRCRRATGLRASSRSLRLVRARGTR